MFDVGRICIKIAGRDAGQKCVIVSKDEDSFVTIDGQTRRRKCNVCHLEPTTQTVAIKSGATHADVVAAFEKLNIQVRETKPKKSAERPKRVKKKSEKTQTPKKKKASKKEEAPKKEEKKSEDIQSTQEESTAQKKD